ncbi:MAG: ABC transporter permease [Deltaproteobacteria bacterium]|nr:ABC transporter permease [Deltaproteobacteria bacterium]
MGTYLVRRLGQSVITVWALVTLSFFLLKAVPGGPFDEDKQLPPEIKANIERKYNLHLPWYQQYFAYLGNLCEGDLGPSYKYLGRSVNDILADTFPVSLQLGLLSIALSFLIGIPLGMLAAYKQNTWVDTSAMFLAIAGVSLPSFLVGAILILIFAHALGWLPAALWEGPRYMILPAVTLGIRPAAIIARLTRSSMLDVIHSDYVRTARAKGLDELSVIAKHVLRNSLIPVITFSGPLIAGAVTGSFIVEHMFAIPGMGKHFITAVTNRDYTLIMGTTVVYGILLIGANIMVDFLYTIVDPRIKIR